MAWPVLRQNGFVVDETAWNEVVAALSAWGGETNAGGHNLSNLGVLSFNQNGYINGPTSFGKSGVDGLARFADGGAVSANTYSWDVVLGYNLKITTNGAADALKTLVSHPGAGYRGIRLGAGVDGIAFYCETGATIADATVTPTPKMILTDVGNLGINQAGAEASVDVMLRAASTSAFRVRYPSDGLWAIDAYPFGSQFFIDLRDGGDWNVKTRISSSHSSFFGGSVGFGTTEPYYKVHAVANAAAPSLTYRAAATASFDAGGVEIAFGTSPDSPWPGWIQTRQTSGNPWTLALNPAGGPVVVGLASAGAYKFVVNSGYQGGIIRIGAEGDWLGRIKCDTHLALETPGGADVILMPNGVETFRAMYYGRVAMRTPSSEPDPVILGDSQLTFWLDEVNHRLYFKSKNSAGTVKNGYVQLS